MIPSIPTRQKAAAVAASQLYRSILRAHKQYLPNEMKELGNTYVKSEFQLHKTITKPEQIQQFLTEWQRYLDQLVLTARAQSIASTTIDGSTSSTSTTTSTSIIGQQQQQQSTIITNDSIFQFGRDLPPDVQLSEEQIQQLQKLRDEAYKVGGTSTGTTKSR